MTGISYPVEIRDFDKIERQNPGLTLSLYGYRDRKRKNGKPGHSVFPIRIPETIGAKHVDLLYLSNDKQARSHYVWIKNLGRLLRGQYFPGYSGGRGMHLCRRCLQNFTGPRTLELHEERCREHRAQRTVFPPTGSKLCYEKVGNQMTLPCFAVADIESVLRPILPSPIDPENPPPDNESATQAIADHVPCAAKYMIVCSDPRYGPLKQRTFEGEGCVGQFIDALQHDVREITKLLDVNVPHGLSRAEVRRRNAAAVKCYLCEGPPKEDDRFVLVSQIPQYSSTLTNLSPTSTKSSSFSLSLSLSLSSGS